MCTEIRPLIGIDSVVLEGGNEGSDSETAPSIMNNILQFIRRGQGRSLTLLRDTRGLSTVEYVIILVLVAALAIGSWRQFGGAVKDKIDKSTGDVQKLE